MLNVATGEATMKEAVGPAVGCLMATFGTNMIASCIFDFDDPEDLRCEVLMRGGCVVRPAAGIEPKAIRRRS